MAEEKEIEKTPKASPVVSPRATNKLGMTRKEMTDLKVLYREDKKKWKTRICGVIREKPDVFEIMDLKGSQDDGTLIKEDFLLHFKNTFDEETVENIWKDLEKCGDENNKVTVMEITRWTNERRRPTAHIERMKEEPKHNEKWLYKKLKSLTFVEVDDGRVGYLTKDAFLDHFTKEGVNKGTANKVFKQIDADHNGSISVKEFITWQNNFNQNEFRSMHELPEDFVLVDILEETEEEDAPDKKEDESGPGDAPGGAPGSGQEEAPAEAPAEADLPPELPSEPAKEEEKAAEAPAETPVEDKPAEAPAEEPVAEPVAEPPKEDKKEDKKEEAPQEELPPAITNYRDYQRIWAKSVNSGKWRECAIISEKRNKIKVHYLTFHRKYDEWLLTSSDRVSQTKPITTMTEGDMISTYSKKMKQWIVAEVLNTKPKSNRVQVRFVGTTKELWLQMDDPRISASIKEPDDPFGGSK